MPSIFEVFLDLKIVRHVRLFYNDDGQWDLNGNNQLQMSDDYVKRLVGRRETSTGRQETDEAAKLAAIAHGICAESDEKYKQSYPSIY